MFVFECLFYIYIKKKIKDILNNYGSSIVDRNTRFGARCPRLIPKGNQRDFSRWCDVRSLV